MKVNFIRIITTVSILISSIAYADNAVVILNQSGCRGYFIADGVNGYYLLEWFGGYDPMKGDSIVGKLNSYGLKDVYYPNRDRDGKIYVNDYLLSRSRVLEKYVEKCD